MPYRRRTEPPPPQELVPKFEAAIKSLVRRFRNHPYAFYTETDMHCYLYHRLYSGGMENALYRMVDGRETILLHKEYPTIARYQRLKDGKLQESATGRRRGAFDLCVWDPRFIAQQEHRKQKVLCAAELALNQCGPGNLHTVNDATKLAGPTNEIKYGYLVFFVRDDPNYERNEIEIWQNLNDAALRVRIVFAMVNGTDKPKPQYLGSWGEA
ncbi:MAG: hypothetical protein M1144_06515 [Candidatus Thermoplasmatota archaeon]|nr:hypothetical protein [Candidatus Thermoplasmatota archaeon]